MTQVDARNVVRFGGFELYRSERRLASGGQAVAVGPRAFDVLVALVERAGQLVTKEELFERVWPRLVVEENNLQVQVSALRKILGTQAIETVPGSGYRFLGDVETAALPASTASRRDNLPPQVNSFVGREHDIAQIRERLQATGLLTIVGLGGLGKSRLVLRVAADVLADYPDGTWFVDLAPIVDSATVPQAVGCVLGVSEGRSMLESLTDHLADRRTLLILDNCEHVLAACAELAKHLLIHAPRLQILATSREALHIFGEAVHALSPLALPADARNAPIADIMACESVRLFADRAGAASPTFHVADRDVPALVEICRCLDGIPLALELAAARVRVLSPAAIAQRLAKRFALLTSGDRTAFPRQQTLRAMIDWSHALLTPNERVLLARLAVFAGGCALEDAEAVAAGGSVATEDVLDLLSNLVEKSLVVYDPASGRYRLLDTVREYARERLTESGEEAAVRDRHLARFLALAEHAEPGFRGPDTLMWMAQLNRERDNFLSALAWCGSAEHAEDGLLLLDALRMWLYRSSLELGSRVAREALEWPAARARTRGRCLGAYVAATIAYYAGRNEEAIAYGEECLAIAREIDDPLKAIDALVVLGVARMGSGDRTGAREALVDALARSRNLADEVRISDALCNLAELYTVDGEPGLAIPLCEENLALVRSMGNRHAVGINACNLARNHLVCGSRSSVVPLLREVVSVIDSAMPEQTMQQLLAVCAGLASFDGEWERAARLYGAAEMDLAHRGGTREAAERLFLEPLMARARERLGSAAFEAAERSGRALGYEDAVAEIDEWLSHRESSGERAL